MGTDLVKQDLDMQYGKMNSDVLVSIWMICYNQEEFISQAIDSVLMQKTNFPFKLFIGEDCSLDRTREICIEYSQKYSDKIVLILNEKNIGAINNAKPIYKACFDSGAKYMALLEGDDYWTDPFKLQKQVDFLEAHQEYGMCFTRFRTLDNESKLFKDDKNGHFFTAEKLYIDFSLDILAKGWHVGTQTLVFETALFPKNAQTKYKYFKDVHLFVELLIKKKGACLVDFCAVYRIHELGIYNSKTEIENARLGLITYKELYKKNRNRPLLKLKYKSFYKYYNNTLIDNNFYLKAFWNITKYSILAMDLYYFRTKQKKLLTQLLKN